MDVGVVTCSGCDAETARLGELRAYGILDTEPEEPFDRVVALARMLFNAPMATITMIDHDRQWFKARSGVESEGGPREHSFCNHAMAQDGVFVVPDATLDPRFAENPLVVGAPNIRFYAGAPLRGAGGHGLGAVCVISPQPREGFSSDDQRKLQILADIVGNELELKRQAHMSNRLVYEKDFAAREAHYQIKNTTSYANLLAEVQSADISTEALSAIAMAAWKQYTEAGGVVANSIRALRGRMAVDDYNKLLEMMPGFGL